MIKVCELFSGIGAQRYALESAGISYQSVGYAEIDPVVSAVYSALYNDNNNLGDVQKLESLPECDLLTISFPCQDLSIAGSRAGLSGERSGLIWECLDLLEREGSPALYPDGKCAAALFGCRISDHSSETE